VFTHRSSQALCHMVCEKRLAGRAIFGYLGGYARFGGSGRTVIESLEIARDVARKLMEAMKSGIMSKLTCIPPSPITLEIFPRAQ